MSKTRPIADFELDQKNANKGTERGRAMLEESLRQYGAGRSILIDKHGVVLAGNKTLQTAVEIGLTEVEVVQTDGTKVVAVQRMDLDLAKDERARKLAFADNRIAEVDLEWDAERIVAEVEAGIDLSGLWYDNEIEEMLRDVQDNGEPSKSLTLRERFVVPPFSVLDARQGYWQNRKRAWIALGIQSELGRGENASPGGSPRSAASLGSDGKTRRGDGKGSTLGAIASNQATLLSPDYGSKGNGLLGFSKQARTRYKKNLAAGREKAVSYQSQGRQTALQKMGDSRAKVFGTEGNASEMTGTSIFDPVLTELAYRWFCPPEGHVLDPFAGGSVRGIVAARLGRRYTGVDLSGAQLEANRQQATEILVAKPPEEANAKGRPVWIKGDSRNIETLAPGEYDFILSCPPYADLEVYSDDSRDLSTMGYDAFLAGYREVIAKACNLLRENRFACFVVGDIRSKAGQYRNFVGDTVVAFRDAGLELWNDAILVTAIGSLPIRAGRPFEGSRKLAKTHQNVLVFVKGDAKAATEAVGAVECGTPEEWAQAAEPVAKERVGVT